MSKVMEFTVGRDEYVASLKEEWLKQVHILSKYMKDNNMSMASDFNPFVETETGRRLDDIAGTLQNILTEEEFEEWGKELPLEERYKLFPI